MAVLHVPFTKMHGAGNDFVVLDNRFFHFSQEELARLARRFCPRRTGVGADGLLALEPPAGEGAHYRMRYLNADGSAAGMCGNGARCLARFARDAGIDGEPLVFDSDAGRYRASAPPAGEVRLFVPPPRDFNAAAPLACGGTVQYVYTGTHHTVVFVDDVDAAQPERDAPAIRHDAAFAPAGTNVNFVQLLSPDRLAVRTFEKGVEGETLACGTGALAAAVVARLAGASAASHFTIEARGGTLRVGFDTAASGEVENLFLEGPAVTVFTGILELPPEMLGE
jgi:diaminopimelate epimerase